MIDTYTFILAFIGACTVATWTLETFDKIGGKKK